MPTFEGDYGYRRGLFASPGVSGGKVLAPAGYPYQTYVPVRRAETFASPMATWGMQGGLYPEERVMRPEEWEPAPGFYWEQPGFSWGAMDSPGGYVSPAYAAPEGAAAGHFNPWGMMQQMVQRGMPFYQAAQEAAAARAAYLAGQEEAAATAAAAGGGGGGGRVAAPSNPAPPGISQQWWDDFTKQHGGATPSEAYGRQGEGLGEALADREWSQGFQDMYGREPTEDDWKAHYFATRGGPRLSRDERRMRRIARKGGARKKLARFREFDRFGNPQKHAEDETTEQRAPLFIPPTVYWRV